MRQASSLSVWRTKCVRASLILQSWRQPKGLSSAFALDQLNCPMTIGLEKKKLIPRRDFIKMQQKSRDFQNQIYAFILSKPPQESIHPHYRPVTFVQTISSRSACRLNEPLTSGEGHCWCAQMTK